MRGLHYLFLTLACSLPLAAISAAADTHARKPAAVTKATAQDHARTKALLAFQHDLVSVLAPRFDAMPLLGAALLARPLPNQPKYNDFHSLIERAASNPDSGAEISWVRLSDCDAKADACPNEEALLLLTQQAPDNAAVWLLKLGQDARNNRKGAARDDLAKAAAAKLYDDYTGATLKALASTVGTLPPPPATVDPASAAGVSGVQVMMVFGMASTQPQPGLQPTAGLCENAQDAVKAQCLALGKTLEWGSSPLARSLGLHLREVLADDPAQQAEAKGARRNLIWQVQNFAALSARAQSDQATAQHLLSLARSGGTEMSLLLSALRDAQIPIDAPAGWEPHKSD